MMNLLGELDDQELADDEELAALVQEIRAFASGPAPQARPALMAVLTHGLGGLPDHAAAPVAPPPPATARRRLAERLQSARARLVLGAGVVSVGFLSTGAAGALPGPAQSAFERAATAVGIELPEAARDGEGAPGPSGRAPELPAGGGGQEDEANDGSTRSGRQTPPPAPSSDNRGAGVGTPGELPPTSTGGDGNRGGAPSREARDEGLSRRPLPPPKAPQPPAVGGGGPLDGAPKPAAPGRPDLTNGGRLDGVPGQADEGDDEQDEDGPGRPEIPGRLPANAGTGPNVPAPAGGRDSLPSR
ncbi:MAG: hypothetical protein M3N15_06685 [Actinomycetota bacterium]|nr:hypothetical protein [Actinomycetota bacterium]